jgi:hypothetical protein
MRARSSNHGKDLSALASRNVRWARRNWVLSREQVCILKSLTLELQLSVARGDLKLINGAWYVTHAGLMRLARRSRCAGIRVRLIREFCDPSLSRWVFETVVYKSKRSKGLGTEMPMPLMFPRSFEARKCAWRKLAPLTAPFAKPTASGCALSRNSVGNRGPIFHLARRNPLRLHTRMAIKTATPPFAIASVF